MRRIRRRARGNLKSAVAVAHRYFCEPLEQRCLLDGVWDDIGVSGSEVTEGSDASITINNLTAATWTATIDWHDGTFQNVDIDEAHNSFSHTFADNGYYPGELTIHSPDDGDHSHPIDEYVYNDAPYASPTLTLDETSGNLVLDTGPITDSSGDLAAGIHYSFALSYDDLAQSYGDAGTESTWNISPDQGGPYEPWVRILDHDEGFRDYMPRLAYVPDLAVVATSSSQVNLTWQDVWGQADSYRIQRSTDGHNFSIYQTIARDDLEFANDLITWPDTGLEAGTKYWYRVRAVEEDNPELLAYSPKKVAATILPPPIGVFATNLNNATNDIVFNWQPGGPYDHVIVRQYSDDNGVFGTTPIAEYTRAGTDTSYTFKNNAAGVMYGFTAQGVRSGANGNASNSGSGSGDDVDSDETHPVENQDEPAGSPWSGVMWENGPHQWRRL
jgi:hypothetical protein